MDALYKLSRPFLFRLDAEAAHRAVLESAAWCAKHRALLAIARGLYGAKPDPLLKVDALGMTFPNPLGLAAGLDKDGEAIAFWNALGFGFIELGTVTPGTGQPGNEPPRLERIREDEAIVNRMGFNNKGAPHLAAMMALRDKSIIAGANIGKAKVTPIERAQDDYVSALKAIWTHASYVVINVSSPNTPNLRDLQNVEALGGLVADVLDANRVLADQNGAAPKPVLLKIAPDLADEDVDAICDLALRRGLSGLIATNTTLRHDLASRTPTIAGGLSGPPLKPRALELVARIFRRVRGKLIVVGVGGIRSADDAYERICAGATLVQVYTGLIYEGPGLVASIIRGLGERVRRDGHPSIGAAVGAALD